VVAVGQQGSEKGCEAMSRKQKMAGTAGTVALLEVLKKEYAGTQEAQLLGLAGDPKARLVKKTATPEDEKGVKK